MIEMGTIIGAVDIITRTTTGITGAGNTITTRIACSCCTINSFVNRVEACET
jgi:hypothetical protein